MAVLKISERTLPAFRHNILVSEEFWITTRTPLYYLDLAVQNERLFKEHYEKVFRDRDVKYGYIRSWPVSNVRQRQFHPDDTSVGSRKSSNVFSLYVLSPDRKWDIIGVPLFLIFARGIDATSLTSGESALRFLNLATLCGYQQWSESLPDDYSYSILPVYDVFTGIYPSILKGIYEKRSEHPLLLKTFWDVFCVTIYSRLMLFEKVPNKELLKFMLDVANDARFDFWSYRYGEELFNEFVILLFVEENRTELISVLLDYGFTILGENSRNTEYYSQLYACQIPLNESILDYKGKEFFPNGSLSSFLDTCYHIGRRPLMELKGLKELYQKLSRSLPLPSLPPSIFRKILKTIDLSYTTEEVREEMASFYEACDVHPSDSNVVAPHKLSHLSRCVIRDRLAANYQLPTAIKNFHLPTLIKRFLRLDF